MLFLAEKEEYFLAEEISSFKNIFDYDFYFNNKSILKLIKGNLKISTKQQILTLWFIFFIVFIPGGFLKIIFNLT